MHKLRYVLAGILMLGLAIPVVTSANGDGDDDGKRCSQIGTWFGVVSPDDLTLTGVMYSAMGKSENYGINILEQPNGDPTLGGFCPAAVRSSPLRGNWERTGKRTFVYNLMGYGVDDLNQMVCIVRLYGDVTQTPDCQFEYITAIAEVYYPPMSPFVDEPAVTFPFPSQWGHRAHVELP